MKLIKRTYLETFLWLIPVLLIGSIFSFFMIKYIIYEETDEYLTYEMQRLSEYHAKNNDLPEFHKVADVIDNLKLDKPLYKDTLIIEPRDNELIPYRELHFSIKHEGKDFTIVLRHLLPGNDDIFEGTLLMMTGLLFLISLFLLLMLNSISVKLWSPFYRTLGILNKYRITEPVPVFPKSKIEEFNSLDSTIEELLKKIVYDYKRTKEFNENASHELQTHLAIIRLNSEKLLNTNQDEIYNPLYIQPIINATAKLSLVQKSLLLLSKIGNLEYKNNTNLNLTEITNNSLSLFQEAISIRNISVIKNLESCVLFMDAGLAEILVNNLLKNAVKHNIQNGNIKINLMQQHLIIENSGMPFQGNPKTLFERFTIGTSGNLGLGLAIVKQICEVYKFDITYDVVDNLHKIQISFP
ncbi:MAG: twp-component sensor histidine [Bacteroidetes bacterium]|nr:MAG: twp-component sensor histidine [Bacteroidota bacterium]